MSDFLAFIIAVAIGIVIFAIPFTIFFLLENWRRLIWESKGRIFRVRESGINWQTNKPFWIVEKRFLHFFFVGCQDILTQSHFYTKEEATEFVLQHLKIRHTDHFSK